MQDLSQMGLVLLLPRKPAIPCFVSKSDYKGFLELGSMIKKCNDIIIAPFHGLVPNDHDISLLMFWNEDSQQYLYDSPLYYSGIYLGSAAVRTIQRAWRRRRQERRLAFCMAGLETDDLLGRVLRTLCEEDLKKLV
jgi:hypothetical protein